MKRKTNLYSVGCVAELLNIPARSLYNYIEQGRIIYYECQFSNGKFGKLIHSDDFELVRLVNKKDKGG